MSTNDESEGSTGCTPQTVDAAAFASSSRGALQCDDHGAILDIVETLRRFGVDKEVKLPQIIVVGDQSSGKSSVLEAISEIPFPREEGLCTRFATVITLRRSRSSTISVKINPHKDATEIERREMECYEADMTDFAGLPKVIADVTKIMGLKNVGDPGYMAFSHHALCIEISGPTQPTLTIVDLPGLIHHGKGMKAVQGMVKRYMKNPRSIILAIISGRNDWVNQVVLRLCEDLDPTGQRTLGVITKPDTIPKRDICNWIQLAKNEQVGLEFERGWHVLRNRGPEEVNFTFAQRNRAEAAFFETEEFKTLPRDRVGIEALKKRLSEVLFQHLVQTLPAVRQEIITQLSIIEDELQQLGGKRTTIQEQRTVLISVAQNCNNLLRSAVSGIYADTFFHDKSMEAAPDQDTNINRFRSVIQYLNMDFADVMHRPGCKRDVRNDPDEGSDDAKELHGEESLDISPNESLGASIPMPEMQTRAQGVQWVNRHHVRSRGSELLGVVPSALIGDLFRDLSSPWESITRQHVQRVALKSKEFVYKVIEHCAPHEFLSRLAEHSVDDALAGALDECMREVKNIVQDHKGPPMTYCSAWIVGLQKFRQKKYANITKRAISSSVGASYHYSSRAEIDTNKLELEMSKGIQPDFTRFTAEEALDMALAYYKESIKNFINNIAVQAIERHLVRVLPDIILSPVKVAAMSDEDVEYVAAEAQETTMKRSMLEKRKKLLEKGLQTFRGAMSALRR